MRRLNHFALAVVAVVLTAAALSCTDDIKADIDELKKQSLDLQTQLANFKAAQNDVQKELEKAIRAVESDDAEALKKNVADLTATDNRLQVAIDSTKSALSHFQEDTDLVIAGIKGQIAGLATRTESVEDKLPQLENKLDSLIYEVNKAQTLARWDSVQIVTLQSQYTELARNVADLKEWSEDKIGKLTQALNDVNAEIARVDGIATEAKAIANRALELAQDTNVTLTEAIRKLDADISVLLQNLDSKYANALLNQVTGVVLPGTDTARDPMRLGIFFGEAEQSTNFPIDALTDKELQMLGGNVPGQISIIGGQWLIQNDGAEGNAGTLYLTINPNTVNFDGVESNDSTGVALENSQGKLCGLKLGKVKKSDALLKARSSRSVQNGFYEIPATVNEDNLNALRADNANDAFAAKVYWKNVNGQLQAVYSQYLLKVAVTEGPSVEWAELEYNGEPISTTLSFPTRVPNGVMHFNATSYDYYDSAPTYKNFVAVTNVYLASDMTKSAQNGDAGCKNALTAANSEGQTNLLKVVEGDVKDFGIKIASGFIYEIAYVTMDYHGRLTSVKYYIQTINS